ILATLATGGGPNLLQHFESVVGVLRCSRLARPCRDTAARTRRPLGRCREPASGVVTRPAGHLDHLIQNLPLVLLRSLHIRLGVPGGDLGTRRHRQPTFHASRRSPFRGHSYVRHRGCFAGTFRESSRLLSVHVKAAYHGHRDLLELLKHFLDAISTSVWAEGELITCHFLVSPSAHLELLKPALDAISPRVWAECVFITCHLPVSPSAQ